MKNPTQKFKWMTLCVCVSVCVCVNLYRRALVMVMPRTGTIKSNHNYMHNMYYLHSSSKSTGCITKHRAARLVGEIERHNGGTGTARTKPLPFYWFQHQQWNLYFFSIKIIPATTTMMTTTTATPWKSSFIYVYFSLHINFQLTFLHMVCLMYDVWLVFVWRTVPYDDDDDDDNDNIHKKNRDIFFFMENCREWKMY